jgi:histone H3/H4
MPRKKRQQPKKLHAFISLRVLHRKLQSDAKDVRVSPLASRALQQQLYAITDHLVSKAREHVRGKRRRSMTVDEKDVIAVYNEFIDPRKLATQLSADLMRLASEIEEKARDSASEFQEGSG